LVAYLPAGSASPFREEDMTRKALTSLHSRRTVIKAAAASTASIGLLAATRTIGGAAATNETMGAPIVAYVSDAGKSEVVVMVGTREIVRRDAGLVARLIAIAKEATDVVAS
jgi:hypothetical protein